MGLSMANKLRRLLFSACALFLAGVACAQGADPVVTTVNIVPSYVTVERGSTTTLVAHALDQDGAEIPASVTWLSSNPGAVSVSSTGVVTGNTVGNAYVWASADNGVYGTAFVNVVY